MVIAKYLLIGVVSALVGAAVAVLFFCEVDLLARRINQPVVLAEEIRLESPFGVDVVLPAGTALNFESAYEDEKYLTLRIIATKGRFDEIGEATSVSYVAD